MRLTFLFLLMFKITASYPQGNLVPNPDFENFTNCPNGPSQINNALPWFQPNIFGSSTDYYNSCNSSTNSVSVPTNIVGYQLAKSGVAYAGFGLYLVLSPSYREYLEVGLTDTLIQGETYCVKFYVASSDHAKYGIDAIGAYLSADSILYNDPNFGILPYQPQVENPIGNIIADTMNWVAIRGDFIANGGEKFITIGNFKDSSHTNAAVINPSAPGLWTYYYIDDVSVVHGSCTVGVEEVTSSDKELLVYPNPTSGIVYFKGMENALVEVMDASGRILVKSVSINQINLTPFDTGIYIIKFTSEKGKVIYRKIILNK